MRHTPSPIGRTPLREGTAGADAIYVADWYLRPLSERGGRREADGVCPGCSGSVWLAQCDTPPALRAYPSPRGDGWRTLYTSQIGIYVPSRRGVAAVRRTGCVPDATSAYGWRRATHPPPCGRTPLREGMADARYIRRRLVSTSPLGEGWPPRGGRGVSRMQWQRMASAVRHTPRPAGVPLSERGRLTRMLYAARIGIHVPSRRGVAAVRRTGCVPDATAAYGWRSATHPPPYRAYPSPRGGRLPHAIYVADWYLRPLSERGGRRQADGVCPGCDHSVWLAPCDTPPALAGVPLSERGRLTRTFLNF